MIKKLDQKILFKLYNFTVNQPGLAKLAVLITNYSSKFFSMIYISTAFYLIYKRDSRIRLFVFVPAAFYLLAKLIPYLYNRKRPHIEYNLKSLVKQRRDHSFPSTHAGSALIISLVFLNINYQFGRLMILAAILTAFSRVMVGVHYPSDILGAWLIALSLYCMGFNILI